ncbi:hypothetical protein MM2B0107_2642 [Mycobacteroides abscessus subsp. bolletii 2B-0107]|nr:hypothetical protein MM1S1510930_3381 [Mycobacteroides abscessus subsp. bolletii 1S-151-0930]EIV03396.1 hypothetical protein MM2B0912R_3622 [Mycobacteroides abscessus subsp. bolletii 2B-0912-R]EIV04943.1 hypothetical protein MM2B0307_2610 [Mycobacteroides abscessus subsp. bolletii 2B-0307]EIV76541.1 hypothetical protein MM2B0107_2642 [Mycobacteroides abscessus subsp. bolletii 2B-0107]
MTAVYRSKSGNCGSAKADGANDTPLAASAPIHPTVRVDTIRPR